MRISTLLKAALSVAILLTIALAATSWLITERLTRVARSQERAQSAANKVSQLLVLTHEYARYAEERSAQQWQTKLDDIIAILEAGAHDSVPVPPEALAEAKILPDVFKRLAAPSSLPPGLRDRQRNLLFDQVLSGTQNLTDSIYRWGLTAASHHDRVEQVYRYVTLAVPVMMLLILVCMTSLLHRRVLKPLAKLLQAVQATAQGDLSVRSATGTDDEFGELSQTFDAMAIDLVAALKQEIADRKKVEAALQESELHFRSYYELGLIGMAISSLEKGWVQYNDSLCAILGYPREELAKKNWAEMTHPDDLAADEAQFQRVVRGEIDGYTMDKRFITKDGRTVYTALSVKCVRNQDGSPRQFVALIDDISNRKQMEELLREYSDSLESLVLVRTRELEEANRELALRRDQAEAANRAKSMFLATMSHELRTPLNTILGMTESLRDELLGKLSPEQRRALTVIDESGRHLLDVITDVLDLSKIEADRLDLSLAQVSPDDCAVASLQFVREAAQRKNIAISHGRQQTPEQFLTDPRRLKQILVNLLSNAVKFTPAGGRIGLEVAGDPGTHTVEFTVWDTGIGIDPEDTAKLFQPFVQVDSSLSRRYEGTGLGLALVARLTRLLDGEVTVQSELGKGSRFTVSLPWRTAETASETPSASLTPEPQRAVPVPASASGNGRLILLAEDNPETRTMTSDYLKARGYRVITAETGAEAVALAGEHRPELILMDIQMPVLDGLAAIQEIRSRPGPEKSVPIIALTALAMPDDRERCLAAGADDYLAKPVPLAGVMRRITELLEMRSQNE